MLTAPLASPADADAVSAGPRDVGAHQPGRPGSPPPPRADEGAGVQTLPTRTGQRLDPPPHIMHALANGLLVRLL
jgi:hypothetical protein